MQKTLISAVILTALLTTGCQDKEAQAEIERLNQKIVQLTEENKQLQLDVLANKTWAENIIPAIFAEEDIVFKKSETIKYPKSDDSYAPEEGSIAYSISTLKTNIDWLNTLLWAELTRKDGNVPTRDQFLQHYRKDFDGTKNDMTEEQVSGFEINSRVDFIGQKEKLATFVIGNYEYTGGAHGMNINRYFTLDLTTHKILTLNDVFDDETLPKVKALLWERYIEQNGENNKPFVSQQDFNVSSNIYLDSEGIHFIYGVYEIAPYALGEQDLTLSWWALENLLSSKFKQQNYVKFTNVCEIC
ncbi:MULTISPECIES: DUF3298 and DUF4163 domain-containing protein [Rodentibacter]|uniref:DUF3298 and DUF4163 domain-containing protein n=1 Tax=Rodentibacter TaxID=1960084 RepID=UPI001CFEF687|nr:DUF3298 and DUF4163 domain-containing protein [Rodentibacter sp. JRC1]GJI56001.1 hypothetical protein HEMROJRC1_11130 [Rodentibacter sp. JRC1]